MFPFCIFFIFSAFSVSIISFFLYKSPNKTPLQQNQQLTQKPTESVPFTFDHPLTSTDDKIRQTRENGETHLNHSGHSLLLEILPSDSPKWASLFAETGHDDRGSNLAGFDREIRELNGQQRGKKKKKKRAKKKTNSQGEDGGGDERENSDPCMGLGSRANKELVCLYPFTSSSSATQRKIKQEYDELVRCHESKGLTLAQVGQFANCLINARNELQHKADAIQRKFTITKALLHKADRSSFDRLRQQIYKLELEQKRVEEDAFVYNWLQQQLKLSPAYKKMLEISASVELKAKSEKPMENTDLEFSDISFEELLAQEKKDTFWQRHSKSRSS